MKKFWKSSNKILQSILLSTFLLVEISFSETPKDIWEQSKSIKKVETNNNVETQNKEELPPTTILQIPKTELEISNISQTEIEQSNRQAIFGIYDPSATNIPLTFWENMSPETFDSFRQTMAQGANRQSVNQLIARVFLSKTNLFNHEDKGIAYLNFVSSFLAYSQDTKLIDSVIDQNNLLLNNEQLLGFLINNNFSNYQIDKACKYAKNLGAEIKNFELQKFKILCLVQAKERKIALANLELIRENGFNDDFFIQKVNFLLGMLLARQGESKTDTLLNIHLSSLVDPMFNPSFSVFKGDLNKTKYFFTSPFVEKILLENKDSKKEFVTEEDFALIEFLEQGSNIELFKTENIFAIYKKIIFGIEDLLNPNDTYTKYHPVKARALLYQVILLTKDQQQKLLFIEALLKSYKKNKFSILGDKVYYQLISDINQKYLTKEVQEQMVQYFESLKKKKSDFEMNDKFLHTSNAVFLLTEEKPETKSKKSLENFANLVDNKKYEATERDVAMINLLAQQKVNLPSSLRKFVNPDEIYIPNKIYNMLEKNENNKATLEVLQLVKNLNSSKEYVRDFLVITKILDRLGFGLIKQDFIKYELTAS